MKLTKALALFIFNYKALILYLCMKVKKRKKTSHHGPSIVKELMLWAIDVPHMPKQREAKM